MRKLFITAIALALVSAMLCGYALADGSAWICPNCHEERYTNYCPVCSAPRPAAQDSWVCTTCGQTWPASYNFCPDDRTAKTVSDRGWPVRRLTGTGTALRTAKDRERRYQSTFGPGRHYPGAGAYKYYKVTDATAFFREGDYVLVDLSYLTVGRRILYFRDSSLTNSAVESVTLTGCPASTTTTVQPMFGPGRAYDAVTNNNRDVTIGSGTRVSVFFETDNWVFAEFGCSLGTIRAWLPADKVK